MDPTPMSAGSSRSIKSVRVSFQILEYLKTEDGASLAELDQRFDIAKSTIHCHLQSLLQEDYVIKNQNEYRLSLRFLDLGGYACNRHPLYRQGQENVDKLANETGETVQLVVAENGWGHVVYQKGDPMQRIPSRQGTIVNLHATAAGKAILAYLPRTTVEEIIDARGLPSITSNTISDESSLFDDLESIRERELAVDRGECWENVRCIAKPVTTKDDTLMGAVSISTRMDEVDEERLLGEYADSLASVAGVLSISASYDAIYPS